jgi:DNA-binding NtrC family response regulator
MSDEITVLLIEDNPRYARLVREILDSSDTTDFDVVIIENLTDGIDYLANNKVDVVLLDLMLPDSSGLDTFSTLHSKVPDIPVLIQTGLDDESVAVDAVHQGAQDYIIKGEISESTLVRSIRYAIERQKLLLELKEARREIRALSGLLPICSYCKRIRDTKGDWKKMETYIEERSEAEFSHSICPDCLKNNFPELYEDIKEQLD